jgi:hypothetical protein
MNQYAQKCYHPVLILLCLLFFSCEWKGGDNFHSIDKGNIDDLGLDLAGYDPAEIIEIPNRSDFFYTLTDTAYTIVDQRAYLDGKELASNGFNRVYIETSSVEDRIYILKVVLQVIDNSLAGHLAAFQGTGMYEGEFIFRIKIIREGVSRLQVRQSLSENKYLRLDWDTPRGIDIVAYNVFNKYLNDTLAHITDLENPFFIDKGYAYGYREYLLEGVTGNEHQSNYYEKFVPAYESIVYDGEEIRISADNRFLFTWRNPNPYPAKYVFVPDDSRQEAVVVDDHSFQLRLPRPDASFPIMRYGVKMYILPESADVDDYPEYEPFLLNLHDQRLPGNEYSIDYGFSASGYLHSISFGKLNVYSTRDNMKTVQSVPADVKTTGAKVKISRTGIVAIDNGLEQLEVYSDASLANRLLLQSGVEEFYFGGDKLLIRYLDEEMHIAVYDINTMQPVKINGTEDYLDHILYMSPDGNYLFARYDHFILLKQEGNSLTKVNTLYGDYLDVHFNEANHNDVILKSSGRFEIRNINTLELIKTINGEFCNVDPVTGHLLYCMYSSNPMTFIVLDKSYDQVLATIKAVNLGNPYGYLFDNILVYSNYFINLNNLANR